MTLNDGLTALIGATAALAHVAIAGAVTVHVLLYKRNVGTSVSWIGIAWLSPFLGALLYVIMGVNRVKRRAQRLRRERLSFGTAEESLAEALDVRLRSPEVRPVVEDDKPRLLHSTDNGSRPHRRPLRFARSLGATRQSARRPVGSASRQ